MACDMSLGCFLREDCVFLLSERWMREGLIGVVWFITGGGNNGLGPTHGGRDDDGVYSLSLVLCTVRFSG